MSRNNKLSSTLPFKKQLALLFFLVIILAVGPAAAQPQPTPAPPTMKATFSHLKGEIYVHTSYKQYGEFKFPSQGLILNTEDGLVLIDTPWDEAQTKQLVKWSKKKFKKKITTIIITHAHDDRFKGTPELANKRTNILSTAQTAELAKKYPIPPFLGELASGQTLSFGKIDLEIFYPGKGHSPDNIVVWFPKEKVLFGGCLIKAERAKSLGNVLNSDLEEWPKSVQKVAARYPDAEIIVPGHGAWGNKKTFERTLELLEKANQNR